MEQISAYQGTVSPGLLVSLMDRLDEEGKATPEVLRTLVSKSRASDCTPSVRASEILLEKGDVREAGEVIRMSGRSQEVLHRSVAEARVLIRAGDSAGARAAAVRAYESDPSYDEPYELLAELYPEGGWPQRHNIQLVFEGRAPVETPGQGRMQELYRIYYEWFRGSRESASEMLAGSRYYAEGDRDFMLASARMSVDEGDWHSAEMMYSKLMPGAPSYLRRELAEAVLESGDHRRALELLAECDQTSERTLRDVVRARHASGDRRETMVAVRAYLDSEWAGSDEYIDAVRELIGYGMDEEASSVLKAYVDSCGNDADSLMLRSELAERAEDCLSALLYATEAVAIGKGSVRVRVRRARVYLAMDDPVKAGKECARILSERPADPDALELMAGIQARDGDHQSAASSYRKLLESRPADPDVLLRFAEALVRTGSNTEAAEAVHRAVRIDGSRDTYVRALSALMAAGPNTDASYLCREAETRFPKDPAVRRIRGNIEYAEGDYLRASASFAEAAGEDPGNPVLWYSKGMSDEARGDMESAEEAFDRALSIDPDEPDYWMAKASVREARGDQTGAVRALDRASELDRRSPQPVVRKAIILSDQGRYGESLRLLGVARCMDPGNEAVLDEIERVREEREAHLQEERIAVMQEPLVIDCCQDVPFVPEGREAPASVMPLESYREPEAPTVVPDETEPVSEADAAEEPPAPVEELLSEVPEPVIGQLTDPEPDPQVVEAEAPHGDVAEEANDTAPDGMPVDVSVETPEEEPEEAVPVEDDVSGGADVPELVSAEPEEPIPDMAAMYKMAASLEEAGDRRGAMRTIESGLEADPDCTDLLRLKSEILLRSGDQEGSRALATRVLELDPEDGEAYRVRGQARLSVGDLPGALQDLDAAVSRGVDNADVHALRGEALERMGVTDRAAECYSAAVSRDPGRLDLAEKLARMMYARKEAIAADSMLNRILRRDPRRMSAILLKAEIAHARKDDKAMMAAYDYFSRCPNPGPDSTVRMVRLLEDSGHSAEAKELVVGRPQRETADSSVKRYAEKALRRAFAMKVAPTDSDLLASLGLDQASAAEVRAYLSEQPDYGPINPGSDSFRRMESLSRDAVMKLEWRDLERSPRLPLERVYAQCGCDDADTAKDIVAYVMRAMLTEPGRNADPRLSDLSMRLPKGISVYDIMRECDLGVYEARVVQSLIV